MTKTEPCILKEIEQSCVCARREMHHKIEMLQDKCPHVVYRDYARGYRCEFCGKEIVEGDIILGGSYVTANSGNCFVRLDVDVVVGYLGSINCNLFNKLTVDDIEYLRSVGVTNI